MLILLAISDIHERVKNISKLASEIESSGIKLDAVIVAGDLTYFKGVNTATRILIELKNKLKVNYVFFIPGNCDDPELLSVNKVNHEVVNIHKNPVNFKNYLLYGIGGGGISPFNTLIEFSEEEFREHISLLEKTRSDVENTIIVTHQPIHGFFDNVNGLNIGSVIFREFLETYQPLLWITGHVHENSGWTTFNRTTIVHPGPFMHGYYALVELDNKAPRVIGVNIYKLK